MAARRTFSFGDISETLELDPLAMGSADHGTVAAPTPSSTQSAVSHLNRWAPLDLVTVAFFWCKDSSCPSEP